MKLHSTIVTKTYLKYVIRTVFYAPGTSQTNFRPGRKHSTGGEPGPNLDPGNVPRDRHYEHFPPRPEGASYRNGPEQFDRGFPGSARGNGKESDVRYGPSVGGSSSSSGSGQSKSNVTAEKIAAQQRERAKRMFQQQQAQQQQQANDHRTKSSNSYNNAGYSNPGSGSSASSSSSSSGLPPSGRGFTSARDRGRPLSSTNIESLKFLGFDPKGFDSRNLPTQDQLKKAYREKAMEWHPDRAHNHNQPEYAGEMFKNAKKSYDQLVAAELGKDQHKGAAKPGNRGYHI